MTAGGVGQGRVLFCEPSFSYFLLSATHRLYCATIQLFVGWGDVEERERRGTKEHMRNGVFFSHQQPSKFISFILKVSLFANKDK